MKYTLKDYQEDAVKDVLENLKRARRNWRADKEGQAFALSAVTGAGKTVMAAAVFEALFYGSADFNFDADPSAVVLWFSDDPSLNEQTHFRLNEASDRLHSNQYEILKESFQQEKFDSGKVYFLNTQKLGKNSLLVRGHQSERGTLLDVRPDGRQYTIWDTIRNTINDDRRTLYLVIDEAHRGTGRATGVGERGTIVQRLIKGHAGVPPMPIVLGISATIKRFQDEMESADGHVRLKNVQVDPAKVQESGLLKSAILLDAPNESGLFETVLLRRATEKIRSMEEAWKAYSAEQGLAEPVSPLLVFQVADNPNPDDVGLWIQTIRDNWPELPRHTDAICHVFGEHKDEYFGGQKVPYVSPHLVQGRPGIRVLLAKSAISTGWDCPRAEVMVSFRVATDETHITQLIGRMVRTPLARSIPGNDRLNSVECLLPHFDQAKLERIVEQLMRGGSEDEQVVTGRRVLFNPLEMRPNNEIPQAVWEKFRDLPSERMPKVVSHPVSRLTWFAGELAKDKLVENVYEKTYAELIRVLDAAIVRFREKLESEKADVLEMEGLTIRTGMFVQEQPTYNYFVERADTQVIRDVLRMTKRILTPELTNRFVKHVAAEKSQTLEDAEATVAALGLVPEIKDYLFAESKKLVDKYFADLRIRIRGLSDERQAKYAEIKEWTPEPGVTDLVKPESRYEMTKVKDANGVESELPMYRSHLLSDGNGKFPYKGNDWEDETLKVEMAREGFVAWYRNPPSASRESLGIAYKMDNVDKITRPDFIFFSKINGKIVADIVDPHGSHFADAIPRLQGMSRFAEEHGDKFRRIDVLSKVGDTLRFLDLKDPTTRAGIMASALGADLFSSNLATNYT